MPYEALTSEEFNEAFETLKKNKSPGHDDINSNTLIYNKKELKIPLMHICSLSLKTGVFPEQLKIAKITPVYKKGEKSEFTNYRPISILPVISKLLERIMYNRIYKHITKNNLLYTKQFGYQAKNSTSFAIIKLIDQIAKAFDENKFTLGIFIDLSKAFDTVDHSILLEKLKYYGIKHTAHQWLSNYLTNRKQYLSYNRPSTDYSSITCGVPQGSILGPLLFLIYVNDLQYVSSILDTIMFADDTNLFLSERNIKKLFSTMNTELTKLNNWFSANKLSLNETKTVYSFFHPLNKSDTIPLILPSLKINNHTIKRETSIKFLGVIIDENITWRNHINYLSNKISKNIGVMYRARRFLNLQNMKSLYFSLIHSYINYGNIAWGSTNKTKLLKLHKHQKHAGRIIFFKRRTSPSRNLMKKLNILNTYQINLYQNLIFMYQHKSQTLPSVFQNILKKINHKYPTRKSELDYKIPSKKSKISQFSISHRAPYLWNNILSDKLKTCASLPSFKNKVKYFLFSQDNESIYF